MVVIGCIVIFSWLISFFNSLSIVVQSGVTVAVCDVAEFVAFVFLVDWVALVVGSAGYSVD